MINFYKYHTNPEELYGYGVPYLIVDKRGTKEWFLNGKLHREDGPASEWSDGTKRWYQYGKLHREDGPAYEGADGSKSWRLKGKIHRVDGPAYEGKDGDKEWWLNGNYYSTKESWEIAKKKYS